MFIMKMLFSLNSMANNLFIQLPCPKNINYFWNLGSFLGMILMIQIMSGFFLSFYFSNEASMSFQSIEMIERNVFLGFFFRCLHMNFASIFFFGAYLHMFRGMFFNSFRNQNAWMSGVTILVFLMMTAFLGYVLPWGQMSFWAATVITKFFSVIPIFGISIVELIWSGFSVNEITLKFFFSLHFILPLIMFILVFFHLIAIHFYGSSDPAFILNMESKLIFSPYFIFKDILNILLFLFFIMTINLWLSSESVNFVKADFSSSPAHIKPEWYFLFAYAILRSVPNKLLGVILMFMAIIILYMMSMKKTFQKPSNFSFLNKMWFFLFLSNFFILSWIGGNPVTDLFVICGALSSMMYFFIFFIYLNFYSLINFFI